MEDRKNCLLIQTTHPLDENQMASLQSALKQAIQTVYQLEENELAAEPLPDRDNRKLILFYEAAEGGAGVLHQLITDPDAFAAITKEALDILSFPKIHFAKICGVRFPKFDLQESLEGKRIII